MWRESMTGGRGWIALALVFFSMKKPFFALIGAIFFGMLWILQCKLQAIGIKISPYLLMMLPYLSTILVASFIKSPK
jgi:general nucleoside transport system permease protein